MLLSCIKRVLDRLLMNKRSNSKTSGTARGQRPAIELEEGLPSTVSFFEGATRKEKMVRWREEMLNWLHDQHETSFAPDHLRRNPSNQYRDELSLS